MRPVYRILLTLFLIVGVSVAQSQELPYAWLNTMQPVQVQEAPDVFPVYNVVDTHIDAAGNVYATGFFKGLCDFDPTLAEVTMSAVGSQDIFLSKYDPNGQLVFVRQIMTYDNSSGVGIAVTASGKIILTGRFIGNAQFEPTSTPFDIYANGDHDIFIARYDATTGTFEDAYPLGSWGYDSPTDLSVVGDELYLTGVFEGAVDFDPSAGVTELMSNGGTNRFVLKLADFYTFGWVKHIENYSISSFEVNSTGVYAAGNFNGTVDLDPSGGVAAVTSVGGTDAWFSKHDLSGNFLFGRSFGAPGIFDITPDAAGNFYVTGSFAETTDFDPNAGVVNMTSQDTNGDAYLSKFSPTADLLWARSWGGPAYDDGTSVAISNTNVVVTGSFLDESIDLDPSASVLNFNSNGYYDVFVSTISDAGNFVHGFTFGGPTQNYDGGVVESNGGNDFIVFGSLTGHVDFDPTTDDNGLTTGEFQEGYITRYGVLDGLPAAQPTGLAFTPANASVAGSFTASGADGYVVLRKLGATPPAVTPKDGMNYLTGMSIGDATIAYAGPSASFNDDLLASNKTYAYSIFSYNNVGGHINYRVDAPLQGSATTTPITPGRQTDSLALIAIYNATNGPAWNNNLNWLTGNPISTWFGVTVSGDRVTQLYLGGNGMSGSLPPMIGNLTALTTLEMPANSLTGNLPGEIFDLTALTSIRLNSNQLSGSIPSTVGQLASLSVLDLSNNFIGGTIPVEIGSTPLNELILHNNRFGGSFPTVVTTMSSLYTLDLSSNGFTGTIPADIGNMTGVQFLSLAHNQFSGSIPTEIGSLSGLYYLHLNNNQFTGSIPVSIGGLTSCQDLFLQVNQLTGSIPLEIGNMFALTNINLGENQLTGAVPVELTSLSSLNQVIVYSNQLTDLPDFSGSFVTSLNVGDNALTFEDLEPNAGISIFDYIPQANIGAPSSTHLLAGASLNLGGYNIGGTNNLYQWQLNGVDVPGETLDTLTRTVAAADAGDWNLMITNSLVPSLTLYTNPVSVTVQAEGMFQWTNAGDLTTDGTNANIYGGVWGDYDNDGFEDVYTVGVNDTLRSYLYHNNGDGTFTSVADAFEHADGRSGVWGDYNNDGFLDIFVPDATFATSSTDGIAAIFKNNQNGTFTKISLGQGAISGAWIDYDFDGDLDLTTEGNSNNSVTTLFRNDGNDVFSASTPFNFGTQWNGIWLHVDDDVRPDYYLPSTYQNPGEQKLLINEGGEFYDGYYIGGELPSSPIGGTWTDIDNDGDYDLYTLMPGQASLFFINDGSGSFIQTSASAFLGEEVQSPRGATFADFNNDGYSDLLVSVAGGTQPLGWTLYLNNGDLTFSKVANQSFKPTSGATGASVADYDNDGDMDILSASFQGGVSNGLYENLGTSNHWLKIKLTGTMSNRNAIGARISVYAENFGRHHQVLTANGFANQNSLIAHFGLGAATSADSVDIVWPSGRRQRLLNLAGDQLHEIEEPTNAAFAGDVTVIDVKQIKGTSEDSENELGTIGIVDGENNTYIVGSFNGSIDLDPGAGELILTAPPNSDDSDTDHAFLAKYDPAGNVVWGQHFAVSDGSSLWMNTISLDKENNILVAGEFEGTVDFDPGDGVAELTTPSNEFSTSYQGYFAKFDNNGNYIWAKTFEVTGDNSYSNLSDIKADGNNNVIITGDFYTSTTGTIDLDPGTGTAILSPDGGGYDDIFMIKLTSEGDYLWHVDINDPLSENEGSIAVDDADNIYFSYSVYDSDTETGSLYVVKYDANSNEIWTATGNASDYESSRIVINNDNVYFLGSFDTSITLNGTTGTQTLTGISDETPFLARFDLDGGLQWAKAFETSGYGFLFGLTTTSSGDVVVSGMYEGSMDMDPGTEKFEQFYPGESTGFIKLSSTGDFIWAYSVHNSYGAHQVNSNGELVVGLGIYGATDVDPNPATNIITPVGRENIILVRYDINDFVGLSPTDSLALKAFYDATGGPGWTNRSNWLATNVKVEDWFGVTVENNKVVAINLPSNNLTGNVPADVITLNELHTINVSGNKIQSIPNLSVMPALTTLNVTANRLDFGSLESNMPIATFSYANQAPLGVADSVLVDVGQPYTITKTTPGTANAYQWARNGTDIAGANTTSYELASVDKNTMGQFVMKITNTIVPGLTLTTAPIGILATANVQGKLFAGTDVPATNGTMTLLRITSTGGFDTLKVTDVANDGTYMFEKVILDYYQLLGFADTLVHERALPTYFNNKLYWEEADTLEIEGNVSNLNITSYLEPVEEPQGQGLIEGYVVEDDGTGEGGRTKAKKRVAKAGASVRRVEGSGRGEEETLELIAYVFTNENGEFTFPNLPEGEYRLNIQYPGYPMDPNSFVTIPVGTALESVKKVEAAVEEGKIIVRNLIITGVWGEQYSVDVFPNPTSEKLKINFGYESSARVINLIDLSGREIMSREAREKSHEIDVTSLDLGVYLLHINENGRNLKTIRVEIR